MNVCKRIIEAIFFLNTNGVVQLCILVARCRYILTGRDFPDHYEHSYFAVQEDRIRRFFVFNAGNEQVSLLVCVASHTYVHYTMAEKSELAEIFRLTEVKIPAFSVLVGDI